MRSSVLLFVASALGAQVPYDRILNANREPGNWLTYSGNYLGHRFSPLDEINVRNVAGLKVKWAYQFPDRRMEVSPIVVDGVMYVTGPNSAAALDTRTGRTLWTWKRPIPADYQSIGFGRVNRGPAILDDKLYVATLDCVSGGRSTSRAAQERWSTKVTDYKPGYSMTMAPLAIRGKVVVGVSGGEAGVRGFVDAYDARTGRRAWRFWTIPVPGEPGHETWSGDAWKTGSGATWVTGSYDPELNLVYWGVGNPGPDWNGDSRPGDNLYTCSLIALDGDTGALTLAFPIHAARHARLGFHACSGAVRSGDSGQEPEAGGDREPQRILLRAGSRVRRISGGEAVCAPDLGQRPGRSRASDDESWERAQPKKGQRSFRT